MSTAADNEKARQSRTERELERLESQEQGTAKKKKKKVKEKIGTGRDDSQANFERIANGLRKNIVTAQEAGNHTLAAKLEARLAELRKTVQ